METRKLLDIIENYKNTNQKWIKNNIYDLLNQNHLKRSFLVDKLNISTHSANNYVNQAMSSPVPLEIALRICLMFDVELNDLMKENNRQLEPLRNLKGAKWTNEKKEEFLKDFNSLSSAEMSEKYNLKKTSVTTFYAKFLKENNDES